MRVRVDWPAARQGRWYEHAIRFALGGAVTAGAGLLARGLGPRIGGLVLAFPAIFVASVTLIEKHQNEKVERGPRRGDRGRRAATIDAAGAAIGSFALMAFAGATWLLLGRLPSAAVLGVATLTWLAIAPALWKLRKRTHFTR